MIGNLILIIIITCLVLILILCTSWVLFKIYKNISLKSILPLHIKQYPKNKPIKLISFASGNNVHYQNQELLSKKLKQYNNNIIEIKENEYTLKNDGFYNITDPRILQSKRGYMYWVWKPWIILKNMKNSEEGSIIIYLDSGAYFKKNIKKLIQDTYKWGSIFINNNHKNNKYCKKETLQNTITNNLDQEHFKNLLQIDASCMFFINNIDNQLFVTQWLNLCLSYDLISDDTNFKYEIKDHRHDQSLLSILLYKTSKPRKIIGLLTKFWYINHHRNIKELKNNI
jgi:hypothetical protein